MEPTVFRSVGEPTFRFQVDLNFHSRHLKRIEDFLAGAGVKPMTGYSSNSLVWTLEMTRGQRDRWDAWLAALP